ncbi:MAG TPA: pitrilysin family protein, partial [Rhizomicrobium sp.]|nr:pitrilysin family protein [Rhizomicrobium sp.]
GMAHAQEHMMFRGNAGLSADQLANIGSIMGGDFNANTSESVTQYLFTVPSTDLDVVLHIEALRMADVTDNGEAWDQERGAIEQEVAEDISNPRYVMYQRLRAALFAGTPYEHDALGSRPSFDKTTAEMLKKFHDTWYAPNNAVLVVAGDVDPQSALDKIKTLFGSIASKALPARAAFEFRAVNTAPIQVETNSSVATKMITMRLPGSDSADFPALEVLADVLSSRRFQLYALVPQGKAISARFSLDPLREASIALASISVAPGADLGAAETTLRGILTDVARNGVPAELVAAAKAQEYRSAQTRKNSVANLASAWSDAVAEEGLDTPDDDLARIEGVTPEDVNRVARQYLDLDHAVTVTMTPRQGAHMVASEYEFGHQESIALGDMKPVALPDWATSALDRLDVPQSTLHPIVTTLANGITLIVQPETVSDTVSVYGHIQNRPETETATGKEGVAELVNAMFKYGSQHLDRVAFQESLDAIGAGERGGPDFQLQTMAGDFDQGVALLADNELHPSFSPAAMKLARDQYSHMLAARMQTPSFLAGRSLRESLFTKGDPSLREPLPENIGRLSLDDVVNYYRTTFRPDLTTIVVIGKITPEKARTVIEKYFGAWRAIGPKPEIDLPAVSANRAAILSVPDESKVQDTVTLAENVPLARKDPDYYALSLGNAVLAGGFYSSRLSNDLRKKTGLVYSVDADLEAGNTRSLYLVSYACDPGNVAKAAAIVSDELKDLQTNPVSSDELNRAKAYLLRQIPLGEANFGEIAHSFAALRDQGLPLDEPSLAASRYVDLDAGDVQKAFRKWMRPGDLVRVSQGPTPQ